MSKRFLPVILALTAASFFIAFQTQGHADSDNPKNRYIRIIRNVGVLLADGHFSPKKIDDNYSKEVMKKFLNDLDTEKYVFLASDIASFKQYETRIDDEMKGADLESFFKVNEVYMQRLNEVMTEYQQILEKPFDFTVDEKVQMDPEKMNWPATAEERSEVWRKRMKYLALSKFIELQDEREKNKAKDSAWKDNKALEKEAREYTKKIIDRMMSTRKSRETNDEVFSTFVNAITTTMDPHTTYMPPVDLRSFNELMSGRFYGIGAQLKEEDGKIRISSLVSGGPAWKQGDLKENDEIIKVAEGEATPVDVTGYSVPDAVKLIRGATKGSIVKLTIRRMDGTTKVVSIVRDEIKLEDTFARSAIINSEYKIGYIYLPDFYADFERRDGARSAVDVAKEIEKLKGEKVDGIVLDLRGNGGGSLYDVVQMAGLFIEEGPIVQVKGRDERATVLRDRDRNVLYSGPLAVMVDETSASASEIFAAAIQDYKRGIVVGSTSTYGKGTVQRTIPLNPISQNRLLSELDNSDDLGSVKLTLQKFYRINGDATQLKGVIPDVILPDRLEHLKFREKDNPYSLKWDEIESADYQPWVSSFSTEPILARARQHVKSDSTFGKIKMHVEWLKQNSSREYSLKLDKYRQEQKKIKDVYKEIDSLYKLPQPLTVKNIPADLQTINETTDRAEKNKTFLKRIGEDIFVEETVRLVSTMIREANLAKVD